VLLHFVQTNWMTILVAVGAFLMLIWPPISRALSGIKQVGPQEATQLINHHDALVLDVREENEVKEGRIPHSRHIALGKLSSSLTELEKYKHKPLVVSCRSGARSLSACRLLRKNGFEQVYNLAGGILAWQQANLPVEKK
jgi:rhodanese-related sulfurtransferase